jgi:hypothetical protein
MSHVTPMSAAVDSAWHADTDAGEGWLQPHAASKCKMPPPSRVAGPIPPPTPPPPPRTREITNCSPGCGLYQPSTSQCLPSLGAR